MNSAKPVTPHPTDPALAGRVIAGCRLQTLLGSGGMGAVWKAHHQALDVPVAVKLLLPIKELEANGARGWCQHSPEVFLKAANRRPGSLKSRG